MAWLDDWAHRLELTIDHNRIDEDLTDFPVLVTLSSGVGRTDFDATCVFDELTTISGVIFSDNFSSGGGQWYNVVGTADYNSDYLKHDANGERARTINNINLGKNWEMTFKFKQHGTGGLNDQIRVNPVYSTSGGIEIQIYMRTYSSSSNSLEFFVEGSSKGTVGTYNWFNEAGNWISVRLKRSGNTIYFKVWIPPDSEPSSWDKVATCSDAFAEEAQFDFHSTYTNSQGTGLDDIEIRTNIPNDKKISITDFTGTNKLYTEIESWDVNTKKAVLWTKVPTIASGTDTPIYLYYDKNQLDNDLWVGDTGTSMASNVWTNNYLAVWHMNTDISTTIKDSTLSYPATPTSMNETNYIDTPAGRGLSFSSGDYLTPSVVDLVNKDVTMEVLFKLQNYDNNRQYIFTSQTDPPSGETYTYQTATHILIAASTQKIVSSHAGELSGTPVRSSDIVDEDEWIYWASTLPIGGYSKLYKNGYIEDTATTANPSKSYNHNETIIGARNDSEGTDYLKSDIGILTLSSGIRSPAWIKAVYYSLFDSLMSYSQGYRPVFTASGTVTVDGMLTDDIPVRLYRRSTGELVGSTATISGGHFEIDTHYDEDHYILALYTSSGTNAVIYDWITP